MNRKEAYNQTVKRWVSRCEGEEGVECGFCEWIREQGDDDWRSCAKHCPLYPEVCDNDIAGNSLWSKWYQDKSNEKAQKVLEGVIRVGLRWSEEEDWTFVAGDLLLSTPKDSPVPYFKKGDRIRMKQPHCGVGAEEQGVVMDGTSQISIEMKFPSRELHIYLMAKQILLDDRPEPKFKVEDRVIWEKAFREHKDSVRIVTEVLGNTCNGWNYRLDGCGVFYEENLKPAPKWVDVTEECEYNILNSGSDNKVLEMIHNGVDVLQFGYEGMNIRNHPKYRIEKGAKLTNLYGFRILHLQEEK